MVVDLVNAATGLQQSQDRLAKAVELQNTQSQINKKQADTSTQPTQSITESVQNVQAFAAIRPIIPTNVQLINTDDTHNDNVQNRPNAEIANVKENLTQEQGDTAKTTEEQIQQGLTTTDTDYLINRNLEVSTEDLARKEATIIADDARYETLRSEVAQFKMFEKTKEAFEAAEQLVVQIKSQNEIAGADLIAASKEVFEGVNITA